MFKAVLLDLDGTLIDSRADLVASVNFALKSVHKPPQSPSQIVPHIGNGLRTLLSRTMGSVEEPVLQKAIESFSKYYWEHCVDQTHLYDGVTECLAELRSKVKLAVVTNKPAGFSEKILDELKIDKFVEVLVGGDSTPEKKPHPAPVQAALSALETDAQDALILGDGPQDVLSGRAAGTKTCLARYGYGFHEDTLKLGPDFFIHRFQEIKEIVL